MSPYFAFIVLAITSICPGLALPAPVNTVLELGSHGAPRSEGGGSNFHQIDPIYSSRLAGKRMRMETGHSNSQISKAQKPDIDLNLHLGLGGVKKIAPESSDSTKHFGPDHMDPPRIYYRSDYMDTADSRETRLEAKAKSHDVWVPGYKYDPALKGEEQDIKQRTLFANRKSRTVKRVGDMVNKHLGPVRSQQEKKVVRDKALLIGRKVGIFDEIPNDLYQRTKHWSDGNMKFHQLRLKANDKDWSSVIQHVTHGRPLQGNQQAGQM